MMATFDNTAGVHGTRIFLLLLLSRGQKYQVSFMLALISSVTIIIEATDGTLDLDCVVHSEGTSPRQRPPLSEIVECTEK